MSAESPELRHAARITLVLARWRVDHGLTANQAEALLQTYDAAALSAAELSRRVGITTASMSRMLRGLERGGWIVRAPDPDDARRSFIQPSKRLALAIGELERLLEVEDGSDSVTGGGGIALPRTCG